MQPTTIRHIAQVFVVIIVGAWTIAFAWNLINRPWQAIGAIGWVIVVVLFLALANWAFGNGKT
jgi:hypothetical protein